MPEVVLRPAVPADDPSIAACIAAAFPDNPKGLLDVLRWQYRENPFGATPGWVWEDEGRIVGHYSAYPMPYLLDGRPTTGANAVDAAVAPSHRGQGLLAPMAAALDASCAEAGMPIAVCYATNPIARRGVAKAGVQWMSRLRVAVLAVDDRWFAHRLHVPRPVAAAIRRVGFDLGRGPAAEETAGVPAGIDALWATARRVGAIENGVDRGDAWWRWRYVAAPGGGCRYFTYQGRAAAVAAEREQAGGRFGLVLELIADDAQSARSVLRGIAGAMPHLAGLATVGVGGGPLLRLARAAGFRTLPVRLEPRGAWYGIADTGGDPHGRAWHIGGGDLDHL